MTTISQVLSEKSNDYSLLEGEYFKSTGTSLSLDPTCSPSYPSVTKPLSATVVIPAWNASTTILSCLIAIEQSSFNINHQSRLQVIVVDDGSTDKTWEIVRDTSLSLHLTAIRQHNYGQSQALNTGIGVAEGDIIISCDADMILNYYALEHFVTRHQLFPNVLLAGFRSDTTGDDPRVKPGYISQHGGPLNTCFIGDERITFSTPGWPSNMCLASIHYKHLGHARGLWMPGDDACEDPWRLSDLVFGALFSLSKDVYLNVGGYDERLHGWGCTDGLLAAKAIAEGQYVIPVYAASGLHISHQFRTGNKQLEYMQNRKRFFEIIQTEKINSHPSWITHAKDRIVESFTRSPVQTFSGHPVVMSATNKLDNLLAIGEYSKAYGILTKSQSTHSNEDLLLKLGKTLIGMDRYKEAVDVLEGVSLPTIELAIAQAANGQFVSARVTLTKLSQIHPETSELSYWYQSSTQKHIIQGHKYLDQGFHYIARRCFEAALIAEPNNKTAFKFRDQCLSNGPKLG